jgi:3,4-dihydroxy 2-butanone 4-phosphate synthase/GTP cyclohydrolase II
MRCDCGFQLESAMRAISNDPAGGAVVYLKNHEGRGIGLWNKVEAYALQDRGLDTLDANLELGLEIDARRYEDAAKMIALSGWSSIRLLSHNPRKVEALENYGIRVSERVVPPPAVTPENRRYLQTKRDRFHHDLRDV